MARYESEVKPLAYAQQAVYDKLSDLNSLSRISEQLPDSEQGKLTFSRDSISVASPVGDVTLNIIEREEPKCIKFETSKSPVPMNMWIQVVATGEATSKMRVTIDADVPIFLKGMVSKPLQEATEKIAEMLSQIPYDAL